VKKSATIVQEAMEQIDKQGQALMPQFNAQTMPLTLLAFMGCFAVFAGLVLFLGSIGVFSPSHLGIYQGRKSQIAGLTLFFIGILLILPEVQRSLVSQTQVPQASLTNSITPTLLKETVSPTISTTTESTAIPTMTNDSTVSPTVESSNTPTNTPLAQITATNTNTICPDYVSRSQIKSWAAIGLLIDSVNVGVFTREFNDLRSGGDYNAGTIIPAGVVIATDFGSGESFIFQNYPVVPLVHYNSSGLFETVGEFVAPYQGACISVVTNNFPVAVDQSKPLTICGEMAFSGNNVATNEPLFKRPDGYTSGWISADPLDLVLRDGSVKNLPLRHVLVVEDLSEVQLLNAPLGKVYGCWYRSDARDQAYTEAERKLAELQAEAPSIVSALYRVNKHTVVQLK